MCRTDDEGHCNSPGQKPPRARSLLTSDRPRGENGGLRRKTPRAVSRNGRARRWDAAIEDPLQQAIAAAQAHVTSLSASVQQAKRSSIDEETLSRWWGKCSRAVQLLRRDLDTRSEGVSRAEAVLRRTRDSINEYFASEGLEPLSPQSTPRTVPGTEPHHLHGSNPAAAGLSQLLGPPDFRCLARPRLRATLPCCDKER